MHHFLESVLGNVALVDASLVCVFIYILLLVKQNHKANIHLGFFIVCCSSPLIFFILSIEDPIIWNFFACLCAALMTVSGSFMYLYISLLSGDIGSIGKKDILHVLPFPVVFGSMLFLTFPLDPLTRTPRFPGGLSVTGLVLLGCIITYAVLTFLKIRSYSRRVENWFSDPEKVSMTWVKAITFPAVALFLLWLVFSVLVHFDVTHWGPALVMPQLLIIGLIPAVAIFYVIRQPEIFKANREMRRYEDEDSAEQTRTKEKYAKQSIDDEKMKEYSASLSSCMQTQKPYLDEGLTIGQLAMVTNIPVHHLSIVINSVFGKNFSSFVSEYRIKEAISHMDADPDANILSIAYRSGFNSKSAFNKMFKNITGKTPSQYRKTAAIHR